MRYVLVQSNADARRFESLGVRDPIVVGNTKFDQAVTLNRGENPQIDLPRANRLVLVAGCIRRGEDEIFANIIARCEREGCPIFFVLVPRHMKDLSELENRLRREKISYDLWSRVRGREINRFSTLVVDSMGELTNFYRIADLTFVGGSLVPIGGHDPAEPAALGRPVIFGPHMENASMAARLLLESGGATMIHDGGELFEILRDSVGNRASLADRGERCRAVILSMAGVSKKIARILMGESF
jgi:3-deoxy-D-manno-octulosonic-acid transferase